jgi:uncharacterized membrane protein
MIDDIALARAIHIASIVHWIGGVAAVTTIVLPRARMLDVAAGLSAFEDFERRFAPQARISVLLAGLSGLWMLWRYDAWERFLDAAFWWLSPMVVVWAAFALMLFVLEPLGIDRHFRVLVQRDKERAFRRAILVHRVALGLALIAILAAVIGAHGSF